MNVVESASTVPAMLAAFLSRNHGRKRVMLYSGAIFMVAAAILASA